MQNQPSVNEPVKSKPFCIGILVNETNLEDIRHYNEQFKMINKRFKDKVKLSFFTYNPDKDAFNSLKDVEYVYVKNVSVIHRYKQFNAADFNLIFIPLIISHSNISSKNIDEFFDAARFNLPVLVCDISPFNRIITNNLNGFLYKDKDSFKEYFEDLLAKRLGIIEVAGKNAHQTVLQHLSYSEKNTQQQADVFKL